MGRHLQGVSESQFYGVQNKEWKERKGRTNTQTAETATCWQKGRRQRWCSSWCHQTAGYQAGGSHPSHWHQTAATLRPKSQSHCVCTLWAFGSAQGRLLPIPSHWGQRSDSWISRDNTWHHTTLHSQDAWSRWEPADRTRLGEQKVSAGGNLWTKEGQISPYFRCA